MNMSGTAPGGTFIRREGEYWTITYHDTALRLRDTKGLRCIAHLLRHPGTRVASRDLMQEAEIRARGSKLESLPDSRKPETRNPEPISGERARLAVTKRIKAAVKAIHTHHPALGYHLSTAVKTGAYCVYLPDPDRPIVWTT
jgi:hypothetical protein